MNNCDSVLVMQYNSKNSQNARIVSNAAVMKPAKIVQSTKFRISWDLSCGQGTESLNPATLGYSSVHI